MKVYIVKIREPKRRLFEHYLRKKFKKKKAKLESLVELLILDAVAKEMQKEIDK